MSLIPLLALVSGDFEINVSDDAEKSVAAIAAAAGWDGTSRINIFLSGNLAGPFEQDVDSAAGVALTVQGTITGAGGDGAGDTGLVISAPPSPPARFDGDPGGPAINAQFPCAIINNGTLAGGGSGGDCEAFYSGYSNTVAGGGGGAGSPVGAGGVGLRGGGNGADGLSATGGAGGAPNGGNGQDLGGTPAITGYANVTYSGSGTLTGGTD